ncbi:MAG TPA: glycosyltransferase family 39 protein [Candidatus Binatia bacterium]|nr:glycosyltransferase family 39 protein [Candidatus Binatia bacterium]
MAAVAPFLVAGLGATPFDDPGEGMHAEIARELMRRPSLPLTLGGVPYLDKPPLLYALLVAAFHALGPGEEPARLVSALAALVAIGATAWLGARLADGRTGIVAGLALGTSLGFFVYGRYVRPEALFVAALALGFALLLVGVRDERRPLAAAGLAAFGLAALAKDPLGALAPPLAVGLALALAGQARPLGRWLPWSGVAAALLLGFGWWIAAERATPGFTWYTVIDNHVLNVVRARHFPDEDVPLGAAEFAVVALLGAVPWVLPAAAMVWRLVRRRAWRDPGETPWVALALWALGVLALSAAAPFRLPHYGLPAYPAIAVLAARGWRELGVRGLAAAHAVLFGVLAVACVLAWSSDGTAFLTEVMGATDVATRKSGAMGAPPPFPPWLALRPLIAATALAFAGGAVALTVTAVARARTAAAYATVATLVFVLPSAAGALGLVSAHRAVESLAVEITRRAGPGDLVAVEGPLENAGALEWYGGRRPLIVDGRRSVLGFGATRPGAANAFWDGARLEREWPGPRRIWLVTARPAEQSVVARLPDPLIVTGAGGRRLYVNR